MKPNLSFTIITAVVLFTLIFSFHLILFLSTVIVAALFGVLFFFELNTSNVERDFEIFNRTEPIRFVSCDHHARHHLTTMINKHIHLLSKLELNRKFVNKFEIDNQLNSLLEVIIKNHIHPWSRTISPINEELSTKLYILFHQILTALIGRLRRVNVADMIINKLVDEVTKHKRLYRMTKNQLEYKIHTEQEFVQMFFNIERKSEKNSYSHEKVCQQWLQSFQFLSRICDILQYALYPRESFANQTFRMLTKQILLKLLLLPLIESFSEPDFINSIIISFLKSNCPTTETFILVLQSTDDVDELYSVLQSVDEEIMLMRSKDQDDDEWKMKQQLSSLLYLKKIILSHLKKFDDNTSASPSNSDNSGCSNGERRKCSSNESSRIPISFDTVLRHNVALEYFIEYMTSINSEAYINFYINVQTFKISIEQGLFEIYLTSVNDSVTNEQYQQLQNDVRDTALNIYETYLLQSENSPQSNGSTSQLSLVDQNLCEQLYQTLMSGDSSQWMNDALFDDIFFQVRDLLLHHSDFFPAFCQSKYYRKLLGEPDLLRDSLDDESSSEHNKQRNNISTTSENGQTNGFDIDIIDTGILNLQGKSFIGYLINVERKNGESWTILRRYSEFFSFHQTMVDKCDRYHMNLRSILFLPPKTVLSNRMNENFIQYRRYMLNVYLKKLNYIHGKFQFLRDDIERFIQPGNYDSNLSSSSASSSTAKNLLNPIKTIGNVFRNQSENLLDGFQRLSRTLSLQTDLNRTTQHQQQQQQQQPENKRVFQTNSLGSKSSGQNMLKHNSDSSGDLSSILDLFNDDVDSSQAVDSEENIPLLLLLDEVFDLKSQHFWLRRRIIELFKQIVEVAFSDTINKKMIDHINESTSTANLCVYIDSFKNLFWPDGTLARSSTRKKENCLRRKVAAKALIMTSLSDLRRVVGADTLQSGLISFFELFQNKTLNLRLVFVLIELILKELLPDGNWDPIFIRLYSSFDDDHHSTTDSIDYKWPPYLQEMSL
ncbi:sorting nexin-13 [Dermatophagoides farinae]|uniref:sorting nexin-13 n=1 Tax=Dermatophagoides farinae TaxID=6954 RepID=UPI003F61B16F